MNLTTTANAIRAAIEAGHTNRSEIARMVGVNPWVVHYHLGPVHDAEQWERERRRHAEFFKGLSPAQEYDAHAAVRRSVDEW
jgi:hypothetical protein